MYKVITYRSRDLKNNIITIDAAEESVADFVDDKKNKKNKKKENIYIIDGVEVFEEDLTSDERADIESNSIINADGFYNVLQPLDLYKENSDEDVNPKKKSKALPIILVSVVAMALCATIIFFTIRGF